MSLSKFFAGKVRRFSLPFYRQLVAGLKCRRLLIRSCLVAVFCGALFALVAFAGFITAPTYPAGPTPFALVVGDFNGDGIPDLVVVNNNPIVNVQDTVTILLGKGDGSFLPGQQFVVGFHPVFVAVGDFNGDGHLDLAVTRYDPTNGTGAVGILLGNGDGTFQAVQSYAAGNYPGSVAVGDFNGDGILDLAVANPYSNTVSVLLGNGDGTFQAVQSYPTGNYAGSVVVGDFNGDGFLDLAVLGNKNPSFPAGAVSILLGNGDGSFQPPQSYDVGLFGGSIAVADFNGDGHLDLAVAGRDDNNRNGTVSILLGNGDGSFRFAQNYPVGPGSVAVGDFNGDGRPDLAVANYDSHTVSILLGQGDGTFKASPVAYTVGAAVSLAVGDFNRDGTPDLAVVNLGTKTLLDDGTVSILLGKGDGSFQASHSITTPPNPKALAVGDFNRDGVPDLVLANYGAQSVSVRLGNGDGSFQTAQDYTVGPNPVFVAVGDFNGDGILDLAVASQSPGTVSILLGNGDGTFRAPENFRVFGPRPSFVAVGDFNGDGVPDLAVVLTNPGGQGYIVILLGNGDGTFQVGRPFSAGNGLNSVAVGDFNGDGKLDIVTTNFAVKDRGHYIFDIIENDLRVYLGNGDGTFKPAQTYQSSGYPVSVAVGDFNGDGIPDLAVANGGPFFPLLRNTVSVLIGKGDGTFQPAQDYTVGFQPTSVAVGDFNRDGIPDFAVANRYDGTVSVLLGNGDGTFQTAQNYAAAANPNFVAVGDFNGDGYPDLAVANDLDQGVFTILINAP